MLTFAKKKKKEKKRNADWRDTILVLFLEHRNSCCPGTTTDNNQVFCHVTALWLGKETVKIGNLGNVLNTKKGYIQTQIQQFPNPYQVFVLPNSKQTVT